MLPLSLKRNASAVILVMADMGRSRTPNVTHPVPATPTLNVVALGGCQCTALLIVSSLPSPLSI